MKFLVIFVGLQYLRIEYIIINRLCKKKKTGIRYIKCQKDRFYKKNVFYKLKNPLNVRRNRY